MASYPARISARQSVRSNVAESWYTAVSKPRDITAARANGERTVGPVTKTEQLAAIVRMAQRGDPNAMQRLREDLPEEDDFQRLLDHFGDLTQQVEQSHINAIADDDLLAKEGVQKRVIKLRTDLAGAHASPLEQLLIDRICCCWLAMQETEVNASRLQSIPLPQADYHQRRQDRAHRRFLSACKTLAQVRKLVGPNVQVNVAEQQVNVMTGS